MKFWTKNNENIIKNELRKKRTIINESSLKIIELFSYVMSFVSIKPNILFFLSLGYFEQIQIGKVISRNSLKFPLVTRKEFSAT